MKYDYDSIKQGSSIAAEPLVSYVAMATPLRLIHRSRLGISRSTFMNIAKDIKRSVIELAEILPSSYSTLTKKEVFDKATSEHIFMIQELFNYGVEVFGDLNKFNAWLNIAVPSFEGVTPFSLLDTSFGIDLVKEELHKIDHGLPV